MKITLYRAAKTEAYGSGACFAANEEDAEEYRDNPGFGGPVLFEYEFDVDPEDVFSLVSGRRNGLPYGRKSRDAWERLSNAIEEDVKSLHDRYPQLEQALDSRRVRKKLVDLGYEWAVYEDSFPTDAVTWVLL